MKFRSEVGSLLGIGEHTRPPQGIQDLGNVGTEAMPEILEVWVLHQPVPGCASMCAVDEQEEAGGCWKLDYQIAVSRTVCARKLAPPPSVAFSLIEVLLQPTTALTAAHNNFDAAYCRPYCSLLA